MSVIKPGKDTHRIMAMADNRTYGLDLGCGADGAAAALHAGRRRRRIGLQDLHHRRGTRHGDGHQRPTRCPAEVRGRGAGHSNTPGCPPRTWCVKNAGSYRSPDERHRCAGAVAEHRIRQADSAGRRAARGGHGGAAGAAVLRRAGQRQRLRPEQQGQPRRLRQAAEPRLVHARPVRTQRARVVERRRHAGLGRHVVPAEPDRQGLRPDRPRVAAPTGEV